MAANAMRTPSISCNQIKQTKMRDRAGENRRCRNGIYLSEVTKIVELGFCFLQHTNFLTQHATYATATACYLQQNEEARRSKRYKGDIAGKVIDKTNHHVGNLLARNQQALSRFIRRIVPCIEFNIGASHRELLVPSMFPTGK